MPNTLPDWLSGARRAEGQSGPACEIRRLIGRVTANQATHYLFKDAGPKFEPSIGGGKWALIGYQPSVGRSGA